MNLSYEAVFDRLQIELDTLKETLDFDLESLSKKEVQRYGKNMKALLLATLSDPLPHPDEVPDHMKTLLTQTIGIRMLQTSLAMFALGDESTQGVKEEKLKEAKKVIKRKAKNKTSEV